MSNKRITLAEAVTLAKQKENEIFRVTQKIKTEVSKPFNEAEYLGKKEEYTQTEYIKQKAKFTKEKIAKLEEHREKLDTLQKEVIKIRNLVNKKNVEIGQDINLLQMKWLKINLDNWMKLDEDRYGLNRNSVSELGTEEQITAFETKKSELDNKIQMLNHTTYIVI